MARMAEMGDGSVRASFWCVYVIELMCPCNGNVCRARSFPTDHFAKLGRRRRLKRVGACAPHHVPCGVGGGIAAGIQSCRRRYCRAGFEKRTSPARARVTLRRSSKPSSCAAPAMRIARAATQTDRMAGHERGEAFMAGFGIYSVAVFSMLVSRRICVSAAAPSRERPARRPWPVRAY